MDTLYDLGCSIPPSTPRSWIDLFYDGENARDPVLFKKLSDWYFNRGLGVEDPEAILALARADRKNPKAEEALVRFLSSHGLMPKDE